MAINLHDSAILLADNVHGIHAPMVAAEYLYDMVRNGVLRASESAEEELIYINLHGAEYGPGMDSVLESWDNLMGESFRDSYGREWIIGYGESGDIFLFPHVAHCDNCNVNAVNCNCDIPNITEWPDCINGREYRVELNKFGDYVIEKSNGQEIAYLQSADDCNILARDLIRAEWYGLNPDSILAEYDHD